MSTTCIQHHPKATPPGVKKRPRAAARMRTFRARMPHRRAGSRRCRRRGRQTSGPSRGRRQSGVPTQCSGRTRKEKRVDRRRGEAVSQPDRSSTQPQASKPWHAEKHFGGSQAPSGLRRTTSHRTTRLWNCFVMDKPTRHLGKALSGQRHWVRGPYETDIGGPEGESVGRGRTFRRQFVESERVRPRWTGLDRAEPEQHTNDEHNAAMAHVLIVNTPAHAAYGALLLGVPTHAPTKGSTAEPTST